MFGITPTTRVFVRSGATDGRLGYNGLRALIVQMFKNDPMASGHLFCFCNAARNRIRMLWFDASGYYIASKRVERGTYNFLKTPAAAARMNLAQLDALLKGVELMRSNGGYRK